MSDQLNNPFRANYREPEVRHHAGNPFIEALPALLTLEEVSEAVRIPIDYRKKDKFEDKKIRSQYLEQIQGWRHPLNAHFEVERRVSKMIRSGYIGRNPLHRDYWAGINGKRNGLLDNKFPPQVGVSTANSFTIVGDSGTGKSSTMRAILGTYPQQIDHTEYKGMVCKYKQIPRLMVECPYDGSIKALCLDILQRVDEIVDTTYYRDYGRNGRGSVPDLIRGIYTLSIAHGLGLLVIDEIQNLRDAKSGVASQMLNYFVNLVNRLNLPIILIGTPRAIVVLTEAFRQARRMTGLGDIIFRRMKQDEEWDMLVEAMWKYQYVQKDSPLTPEIKAALYDESQGIIDLLVKVFILAQDRAISTGEEIISVDIIHSVSDSLTLVRPFVKSLRDGTNLGHKNDDLYEHINIEEDIANALRRLPVARPNVESGSQLIEKSALSSSQFEGSDDKTQHETINSKLAPQPNSNRQPKSKPMIKNGSLLEAFEKAEQLNIPLYEVLRDTNFIKPLTEFLP